MGVGRGTVCIRGTQYKIITLPRLWNRKSQQTFLAVDLLGIHKPGYLLTVELYFIFFLIK